MRTLLYFILVLSTLSLQSCLKDDENLFDKSASERMAQSLNTYQNLLVSSENGWVLEYYPEEKQSYGGFVYTVKFTQDKATASLDIATTAPNTYASETCLYRLIADKGPVLTFDSYNFLIHYFANPSSAKPDGYNGDYEFVLMGHTDNVITLKGKKTGNRMTLTKLTEPYDSYLAKISNSRQKFASVPQISLTVGGKVLVATKTSAKLNLTYTENNTPTDISVAYIPTTVGIKLYDTITVNGVKMKDFKFNADNSALISLMDNSTTINFIYPPINEQFLATGTAWKFSIDGTNMSPSLWASLNKSIQDNMANYNESLTSMTIGTNLLYPANDNSNKFAFVFKSEGAEGSYNISYGYKVTPVSGTEDQITLALTNAGFNWKYYTWFLPPMTLIASKSPFKMETDNIKSPSYIKFISVSDNTFWFTVSK